MVSRRCSQTQQPCMKMVVGRHNRQEAALSARRDSRFFLDSTTAAPESDTAASAGRRTAEAVMFAIALAAAIGIAGLFGLLQLLGA